MDYKWNHKIFAVNEASFSSVALGIFHFQYENNPVYRAYAQALAIDPGKIDSVYDIPFLPVSFFKTHQVCTSLFEPHTVFESSGTTGVNTSRHFIKDTGLYEESFVRGFEKRYGNIKDWCIIGLLPSYLERKNSSLIYMVNKMIGESDCPESGFYLDEYDALKKILTALEDRKQKTLLIGVTFGLLDFAEQFQIPLRHTVIMETGGMKGRRKEMIREEVHNKLKRAFSVGSIHSEYGMTELLSQAYSKGNGIFECPPWMKVLVRDEDDPLNLQRPDYAMQQSEKRGVLNVIDLANVWSCSFIATEDAGKVFEDGTFEVQGRVDNSDIRGCNLLIA
jgi:phenylacetate-coenzyme A ligase PaaK-like adenylate-forming protein